MSSWVQEEFERRRTLTQSKRIMRMMNRSIPLIPRQVKSVQES